MLCRVLIAPLLLLAVSLAVNAQAPRPQGVVELTNRPTVSEVIKLSKHRVSDEIIIALIERAGTRFELSADEIIDLKEQGVSERVILAMLRSGRQAEARERERAGAPPAYAPEPAAPQVVIAQQPPLVVTVAQPPVVVSGISPFISPFFASSFVSPHVFGFSPFFHTRPFIFHPSPFLHHRVVVPFFRSSPFVVHSGTVGVIRIRHR